MDADLQIPCWCVSLVSNPTQPHIIVLGFFFQFFSQSLGPIAEECLVSNPTQPHVIVLGFFFQLFSQSLVPIAEERPAQFH